MSNDLIQWICVAAVFLIVAVWIVRYVRGLVRWSKGMRHSGGGTQPPCCGGARGKSGKNGNLGKNEKSGDDGECCCGGKDEKPRQNGGPCAGCGADCPLSGNNKG